MNSKELHQIKNKLKKFLQDDKILDVVIFGSSVKGKALPSDIDIALITNKKITPKLPSFHISVLKPEDFFVRVPSLCHTLLREGYSLKNNKPLSEEYDFSSRVLFRYNLVNLPASKKVKVVNVLRGVGKSKGLVKKNEGRWLANQVFVVPPKGEYIIEKFLLNFKVRFKKNYVLMH